MTGVVKFGDLVSWDDGDEGAIPRTGRVTFVSDGMVRVVPTGCSEQEWCWIDPGRLIPKSQIPGQINIFGEIS